MLHFFCVGSVISPCQFLILEVDDVFATSYPTFHGKSNIAFICNFRVHQRPHSLLVLTSFVKDIRYVESVGLALDCVSDFEIEPLSMVFWICIFIEDQIVLEFSNSVGLVKIAALKSAFENEGLIFVVLQLMIVRQFTKISILLLIRNRCFSRIIYSKFLIFFRVNFLGVVIY